MGVYPQAMEELIGILSRLPGLGPKSATRIALFLLQQPKDLTDALSKSLWEFKEKVRLCGECFNLSETDPCYICQDPKRDDSTLLVVETPGDLFAIEDGNAYKGLYHVLHGTISPLDRSGPEDLKIRELVERIKRKGFKEVIIATNPTFQGEATAHYLMDVLERETPATRLSRIAVGLPMGGDIKYIDKVTLEHAIRHRKRIDE